MTITFWLNMIIARCVDVFDDTTIKVSVEKNITKHSGKIRNVKKNILYTSQKGFLRETILYQIDPINVFFYKINSIEIIFLENFKKKIVIQLLSCLFLGRERFLFR